METLQWQAHSTSYRVARQAHAGQVSGIAGDIIQKTRLCIDPYFSATKIAWFLDKTSGARARAERGEIVCGT